MRKLTINSNFSKVKFPRCALAQIRDFYNEPTLPEMKVSMKDLFSKHGPGPQKTTDLFTFTEKSLIKKLHFCAVPTLQACFDLWHAKTLDQKAFT